MGTHCSGVVSGAGWDCRISITVWSSDCPPPASFTLSLAGITLNKPLAPLTPSQHLFLGGPSGYTTYRCCYQKRKSEKFYAAFWASGQGAANTSWEPWTPNANNSIHILCCDAPYWYFCSDCVCVYAQSLSCLWHLATLWTVAGQAPLCPWDFQGKNSRVGCHFFLQGNFLTQGWNPYLLRLLHWQVGSLPLSHRRSPLLWRGSSKISLGSLGPQTSNHNHLLGPWGLIRSKSSENPKRGLAFTLFQVL